MVTPLVADSPAEVSIGATTWGGVQPSERFRQIYGTANAMTLTKTGTDTNTDILVNGNSSQRINLPVGVAGASLGSQGYDGEIGSLTIYNFGASTATYKVTFERKDL